MNAPELRKWLSQPRLALTAAVAACVQEHVATLRSRGLDFYGYALLPGEPYDIRSLVAAFNCESDITPATDDQEQRYFRYSVDEWQHYESEGFGPANKLLAEASRAFAAMHVKDEDDCNMDEFELAHSNSLLNAVLEGLEAAKAKGVFGVSSFLVLWIHDSDHEFIVRSAQRLNSASVAKEAIAAVV